MPIPAFPGKLAGRPYLTPQHLFESRRASPPRAPAHVVLCWQRGLLARVRRSSPDATQEPVGMLLELAGTAGTLLRVGDDLGVALVPIGAPTVAIVIEELAARGTTAVIGVGYAGGLGSGLRLGDLVICTEAVRDEGTSHHYLPADTPARPDPSLCALLQSHLPAARRGATWTTDAPYRETVEEVAAHGAAGVLTVEMEAAALFAAATVCGARAAAAFCVSDLLGAEPWEHAFTAADLDEALWRAFVGARATLQDE